MTHAVYQKVANLDLKIALIKEIKFDFFISKSYSIRAELNYYFID